MGYRPFVFKPFELGLSKGAASDQVHPFDPGQARSGSTSEHPARLKGGSRPYSALSFVKC
jgi:hypothetical protein